MPATYTPEWPTAFDTAPLLKGMAETARLNSRTLARASEILSEAARAILETEIELVRLEAEEGVRLFFLARPTLESGKVPVEAFTQWHDIAERTFAQMRGTGDLMRQCGWELFDLYVESVNRPGKSQADA